MRDVSRIITTIVLCFFCSTAYSRDGPPKIIAMQCDDIVSVHIAFYKPPENVTFVGNSCKKGCYYPLFLMKDDAAKRFNREMNVYKDHDRDIYLNNVYLFTAKPFPDDIPFPADVPYTQIFSSGKEHDELGGSITEVQQICPGIKTALPGTPAFPFK